MLEHPTAKQARKALEAGAAPEQKALQLGALQLGALLRWKAHRLPQSKLERLQPQAELQKGNCWSCILSKEPPPVEVGDEGMDKSLGCAGGGAE